jgi:hypothetical protein
MIGYYATIFPGGKGGRCIRLTNLSPSYAVVMKYGNLNFQEPSGPLQACNGSGKPFYYATTEETLTVNIQSVNISN